jgi:hypothetical protein
LAAVVTTGPANAVRAVVISKQRRSKELHSVGFLIVVASFGFRRRADQPALESAPMIVDSFEKKSYLLTATQPASRWAHGVIRPELGDRAFDDEHERIELMHGLSTAVSVVAVASRSIMAG